MATKAKKKPAAAAAAASPGPDSDSGPGLSLSPEDIEAILGSLAFTSEDLERWEEQATNWEKEPIQLFEYTNHRMLVHLQILDYVATHPQPTRTGIQTSLAAAKDFQAVADLVAENLEELFKERRRQEAEKQKEKAEEVAVERAGAGAKGKKGKVK